MPELPPRHARPLVGVFVGGRSRRMGRDKATIRVGPETLLARTVRVAARVGDVVLVGGEGAPGQFPELQRLPDRPAGLGPAAGLNALLLEAASRGVEEALALAVDHPFLEAADLQALLAAPPAAARAVRRGRHWEPFLARYRVADALGALAPLLATPPVHLQRLLDRIGEPLDETQLGARALRDWDRPEDLAADGHALE